MGFCHASTPALPYQQIVTTNFAINTDNQLVLRAIEIVHSKLPHDATQVAGFMSAVVDQFVVIVELMLVYICARYVRPLSGLPVQVHLVPPERRMNKHVRYGYGLLDGENLIPTS